MLFAPNLVWRNTPLRDLVSARVGLPVIVENDANAAAWGEFVFGAGQGVDDMLMLTVGTGLGGGIVTDGDLYRGSFGIGAELGHMRVVVDGHRCGCGNRGCWEVYASGHGPRPRGAGAGRVGLAAGGRDPRSRRRRPGRDRGRDDHRGRHGTTTRRRSNCSRSSAAGSGEGIASRGGDPRPGPGGRRRRCRRSGRPAARRRPARRSPGSSPDAATGRCSTIVARQLDNAGHRRCRRPGPGRLIAVALGHALTVGIDIGGTKVAAGVVDDDGNIVARIAAADPGILGPVHRGRDRRGGRRAPGPATTWCAVGIGAAGWIDSSGASVMFSPHLAWRHEPLRDAVARRVRLPVVVENDANAAAWAELRFGAGQGETTLVVVNLGTGIGGALRARRELVRGRFGVAGEFGHMAVVPNGRRCECGNRGCWEQYASGNAITREARELCAERLAGGCRRAAPRRRRSRGGDRPDRHRRPPRTATR